MAFLGQINRVQIVRDTPQGVYVDGEALGDVLLPRRYCSPLMVPGGEVNVFVYRDSDDRIVATTDRPHVVAGEFAFLRVVQVNPSIGAFLDWGLEKDLLLPVRDWPRDGVRVGDWLVVRVLVDDRSNRIVASARLARFFNPETPEYEEGEAVDVLIEAETDLGWRAIIEHEHRGLIYRNDVAEPLVVGRSMEVYVRRVREDGKVDLTVHQSGYQRVRRLKAEIVDRLAEAGGFLPLHDGSAPAEIQAAFGVSKKAFKQAIGALYKEQRIVIEDGGIRRVVQDG